MNRNRLAIQAVKADRDAVKNAFLRATAHLAKVDEQVFQHMRASSNQNILDQIMPLTLDALRPLVDELTRTLGAEAARVARDAYLQTAGVVRKNEAWSVLEKAKKKKPESNPFSERDTPIDTERIRRDVAKLVVDITQEQRRALKKVIVRRFDPDSRTNDKLVKDIKATVGLTEREAVAVMNFRDSLEERHIDERRADKEVNRYRDKLHELRAERIARTETVRVETEGRRSGWKQAQKDGLLSNKAEVTWVSNAAACDECKSLDGKTALLKGGTFEGLEGVRVQGPPLHPH